MRLEESYLDNVQTTIAIGTSKWNMFVNHFFSSNFLKTFVCSSAKIEVEKILPILDVNNKNDRTDKEFMLVIGHTCD